METNKVIEQEIALDLVIHSYSGGTITILQEGLLTYDKVVIDKSKATEVAKAIDPKYQELEDDRDRLLEALKTVYLELKDEDNVWDRHLNIMSEAIKQSEI